MTTLLDRIVAPAAVSADASDALPQPPDEAEKYSYLGPQRRWLLALQAVSFALIAYSVARFATADVRLIVFLAPMSLYAVTLLISLTSGSRRRRIDRADHVERIESWHPERPPSFDVFLPSAGEPLDVLANTFGHVARLDAPGALDVWVLDDSARAEVEELARRHGFHYRSRPDRGHLKKAGNLRYGYDESAGDLILVLDADFVPRHDMLSELAPYFDDPEVGIVQSPQYFDTRRPGMRWLERTAGATQELFYRFIQPSRDSVGAAICVGTCAIYRRASLERSGGFAQIGHSEDVHTGVKILKAGMAVRYVPIVVAKGLCPDQASAFLNQQYRWCTGSMSLLVDRSFHEAGELSTRQKLCFWAGFLYYIATAVNSVVAPLPAIAMLWLLPEWIEPMNSIWLVGALVLWFVILPTVMSGRWRFEVLRVQYLYSFAHLVAIWHVLTGKTREWVATGTGGAGTPLAVTIGRAVKSFVVVSQLAIWIGLWRGAQTFGLGEYWAMIGLAVLGAYIQLPLLFLRTGRRPAKAAAKTPVVSKVSVVSGLGAELMPPQPRGVRIAPALRQFRPDIQGMRAVAVLLVVLYHAHVPFVRAGYVGVDVFFVISGFLITGQLMREVERTGRVSLIGFYGARIRRLFPPAALVVVVTLVAARVWDSVFHVRTVTVDALFTLGYAMNYRLAAEGVDYQNASGPVSPLQHMWSLAVEEQFYVVWPLLILGCALVARRRARAAVIAVLLVGFAVSLAASIDQTVANPTYAYFGLHTRAWELALGGLIAVSATMWVKLPSLLATPLSWVGLLAIVWSAFAFDDQTPFPGVAALVPTLGAAALIAAGCRAHRGSAEVVLALPTAQGIGRFSYGWYLWHWPMVTLIPMAVGYELSWPYLVEISLLAFWFAVLTHYLLEAPSRRSRLSMTGWLGGAAVGSTSVAAVAGVVFLSLPAFVGSGAAAKGIELSKTDPAKVHRALVKGLQLTEAPRNLDPSIEDASIDQPESTKNGCHADYLVVGQGACVYGKKNAKRTMVLFGDSHAQQWLPALDRQGKRMRWRVIAWTKAACPIADIAIVNDQLRREFNECYDWRDRTIRRIAELDPDIVVVSQSDSVPDQQVGNTDWADATAASLARLQAADIPVAYVLDTPMPPRDVPDCLATHLTDVGACNLDRATATAYGGRREALDETLSRRGITAWDPAEVLCTSQSCPIVVGGLLVYRDASHLSATFSEWLAPMTEALFVRREGKEAAAVS